ncbi:heme ABC transporter ATP-binding protein [Methanosarcinales archaeon]|nr:MAG: heme ABC transporter ATP-binding protein [Methanosarcinales archaeon]HHI30529.1 heme ABC transporter ATP-binding protein [Candidatus Methanoperedenaceae archaeon]
MLKINNLKVCYGRTQVLRDVSLEAEEGELLGIIGPNGSGKTTLIRAITGVIKPEHGKIISQGENLSGWDANTIAKHIAVVPQSVSIDFEFTIEEIVLMGRTPHLNRKERPEDHEIVRDSMKQTGTMHLKDRLITELSGGEVQRVIIARALAQEPKILLLDEPTSHLDIRGQVEVLHLIKELVNGGMTALAVIHDLNLAAAYCDKIALICNGQIMAHGRPHDVLTPENIQEAFKIAVAVENNKTNNTPIILPEVIRN